MSLASRNYNKQLYQCFIMKLVRNNILQNIINAITLMILMLLHCVILIMH